MTDKKLRKRLIRLAHKRPDLRSQILPLVQSSDYSWVKNADAKGKDVEKFVEEQGDRKVKNPNPDSRDKHPEVKVKSLPNSDEGKGLFQKMFDKWKSLTDKDDDGSGDLKKFKKKFKKPSDKEKLTFWREVKKDNTRDELIDKDEVDKLVKDHLEKAVKLYAEDPPKKAPKKPSMKDIALNYARKKDTKKKSSVRRKLIKLAYEQPELRSKILPVIKQAAAADFGKTDKLMETIREDSASFIQYMRRFRNTADSLGALVSLAEEGRFDRLDTIDVKKMTFDGQVIMGECSSASGKGSYKTRISLLPRRGYNCTCADRRNTGGSVGPCKHVLALGNKFWEEELQPELEGIESAMSDVMDKLNLLPE